MFIIGVKYFAILAFTLFGDYINLIVMGAPADNASITTIIRSKNSHTSCPRILSRGEWHARECSGYIPMVVSPAPYVVVHHGGIPHYCYDEETCARIVRSYQDLHIDVNHWIDVGYHFIIGGDGNVYEGRGWDNVGAHSPGYNGQGIGICIIGDYTDRMPNNASMEALESLIECGISLKKIRPDYKLIGHRQGRVTQCPGDTLYKYLQTSAHWTSSPVPMRVVSTVKKTDVVPRVDITGTPLWRDLIALGVPRNSAETTTTDKLEENVVDTGNATGILK